MNKKTIIFALAIMAGVGSLIVRHRTYTQSDLQDIVDHVHLPGRTMPDRSPQQLSKNQNYVVECNGTTVINQKCIRNYSIDYNHIKYHDETRKMVPVKKFLQPGDILLNSTGIGTLGRTAIITQLSQPCIVDSHITVLRATMAVYPQFLGYQLLCRQKELESFASGSTGQAELSRACLNEMSIKLPSLSEQKKIVEILKSLDDKIKLNNKINANLEAQAQALFKSWFVDFEPFRDGEFIDSELGRIPKGWKVGTMKNLGDVIGGGTPSKTRSDYYTNSGYPWVTPKDLSKNKNKFISRGSIDITWQGLKHSSARLMPRGTVLFSSRAPIGYLAIAHNSICTNQGFKSIKPHEHIGTAYVYYYLKMNAVRIESMASGSTFKELSASAMQSIHALIPDDVLLRSFSDFCNSIFNRQAQLEIENETLIFLRDSLLPRLMSGEISV